ncbi:MAG: peptidylprolyl isomerase [Planctomycetes bacterium]|nr:peptidylprolyl isomerase [Planctomycetota bacterium]MCB9935464.1 peptidylprolyl isomerase [Planctomycetota bacterium]
MGKPVLVSLLAAALFFCGARTGTAQEADPQPETKPAWSFTPGEFLTADDYEHLQAALDCINLTPEDLNYEKKHRPDDKLRLSICDKALDDPLAVPGMAEQAADRFGSRSTPTHRCMHATTLLDLPGKRWMAEELQKDTEPLAKLEQKLREAGLNPKKKWTEQEKASAAAKAKEISKEIDAFQATQFYGGSDVTELFRAEHAYGVMGWDTGRPLAGSLGTISRKRELEPADARHLAGVLPQYGVEAPQGLPGGEEIQQDTRSLFDVAALADLEPIIISGNRLSAQLGQIARDLLVRDEDRITYLGDKTSAVPGVSGGIMGAWQGPWGKFVIGGTGPNTYEGDDFIGIIDLGGDDVYRGRVACGIGLEGKAPLSFVLDLSGNDRYEGGDFTQGFGFLGVGILHDLGGGDDYYSAGFCAQGCGLCGYGELYDDGGNDQYRADSGAQGAGCFGYGQLTDVAGNDTYRGCRFVQGFAQVMGVGVLTDGNGNDLYYAGGKYLHQPLWNDRYQSLSQGFSIGNRNDAGVGTGGGVGMLLDEGDGNDVYQADIYGQGSSYWYSLGMLVDRGGNDTYTLGQYGQGGGIHLSTGVLVDLKGNDTYSNPYGVGLGGAHDWAVAWLIDRAGNDLYQGNGQGQGLNFSFGCMLDCAGDDSHSTNNELSIGKGSNNDISLLMDLGGTDCYGPKDVKDGQLTRRGNHQLVYDVPSGWFPGVDTSTLPTKQDPAPDRAVVQHILIAWDGAGVDTQKAARSKEQAETLARQVLKQARTRGADWKQLQVDYNEDCGANPDGTTNTHNSYTADAEARLVKPFKDLALSLGVGQIDICESKYGFHIIKRIE